MYIKTILVATFMCFMWYFSDYGEFSLQLTLSVFVCVLLSFKFFKKSAECSTQTDEEVAEILPNQEIFEEKICSHGNGIITSREKSAHGSQYLSIRSSLQKVFEHAYAQTVVPWYSVPEDTSSQPLHKALKAEYDLVVDQLISRAQGFDLCAASVGCIRILTQHLHNAKQPKGAPLFSSRTEEMAVLRVFSEALVRNLFPETLWDLDLYHCILNEVVAVKVLDMLVAWLSDPDNLNQLVVSQLDGVALSQSVEDLREPEREDGFSSTESKNGKAAADDAEDVPEKKNKGKRLKEGWTHFLEKMKAKRAKKKELRKMPLSNALEDLSPASLVEECGDCVSNEDSVKSETDSETEEDSDLEDMMEFKLSYEMWRVGNWVVTVTNIQREGLESSFTIHLEDRDNPENLHWDVKKTQTELLHFHSQWQDLSDLPSVSAILDDKGRDLDESFQEEAKATLQNFLQELVSDAQFGHSQPVFQFLCPLDKLLSEEEPCGGVWGLLSGIASLLTPAYEEEEHNPPVAEAISTDVKTSGMMTEPEVVTKEGELEDGSAMELLEACLNSVSPIDPSSTNQAEEPEPVQTNEDQSKGLGDSRHQSGAIISGLSSIAGSKISTRDKLLHIMSAGRHKSKEKEQNCMVEEGLQTQSHSLKNTNQSWEHLEATKAIFDLLKEISGNSFILNIFDAILKPVMPLVKKKVNSFLERLNPTEAQVASYIDTAREKQWPEGCAEVQRPSRTPEEKIATREQAQQLINTKYTNYLILKKTDVETVFKIFQDAEENKKLAYMLLSFLLHEFLPGEPALNVIAQLYVKDLI